jgi:hypothetical protein
MRPRRRRYQAALSACFKRLVLVRHCLFNSLLPKRCCLGFFKEGQREVTPQPTGSHSVLEV